ncbi:hypothetical protein IH970_14970, partial [candidate division KSB1 bacterium]|nr:hypothetical protein [candidate division KSB1 bacterium]
MDVEKLIDKVVDEMLKQDCTPVPGLKTPKCNWCWVCPECRTQIVEELVENGAARVAAGPTVGPRP